MHMLCVRNIVMFFSACAFVGFVQATAVDCNLLLDVCGILVRGLERSFDDCGRYFEELDSFQRVIVWFPIVKRRKVLRLSSLSN